MTSGKKQALGWGHMYLLLLDIKGYAILLDNQKEFGIAKCSDY
jgi:hypothetical protein